MAAYSPAPRMNVCVSCSRLLLFFLQRKHFLSYVNDQEAKNEEQIPAEGLLPRGCWLLNCCIVFCHSEQSDESLSFSVGFLSAFGMTKRGSLRFPLR